MLERGFKPTPREMAMLITDGPASLLVRPLLERDISIITPDFACSFVEALTIVVLKYRSARTFLQSLPENDAARVQQVIEMGGGDYISLVSGD